MHSRYRMAMKSLDCLAMAGIMKHINKLARI
jgi:hypothetical protein